MKKILPLSLSILLFISVAQAQWALLNNGLSNPGVFSFAVSGENIYVGTNVGVDMTTDNAANWSPKLSGTAPVLSLATYGTKIFAGTEGEGIYRSTDNGDTWGAANLGLTSNQIFALATKGTHIFAGTLDGGALVSNTFGDSWIDINTGLPNNEWIHAFAISGSTIFAGTHHHGVYRSWNDGGNWSAVNSGLSNQNVRALFAKGGKIYAGTYGGGIFISEDFGDTWTAANNGLTNLNIGSFTSAGGNIIVATEGGGVFASGDNGTTWTAINDGFPSFGIGFAMAVNSTTIFSAMYSEGVYTRPLEQVSATSNISGEDFIAIFPNPTQGELNIHLNSEKAFCIALYNSLGKKVTEKTLTDKANRIDISSFAAGIYFYRLNCESQVVKSGVICKE